jgi:hypothetical protein
LPGANLDPLRDLIIRSAGYGVVGEFRLQRETLPPIGRPSPQGASIQKEIAQRLDPLAALIAGFNATTATIAARRDHALARLRIVFGKQFVVLPRFIAPNAAELAKALGDSTKVQGGDALASSTWFQRMSRVRAGVSRLNASINYAEALTAGEKLQLNIAQLPFTENDRWVGLPLESGKTLAGGRLSIAVQSSAAIDVNKPLAGLLIDEWVEVVPSATETTGTPAARPAELRPPQTILIAVPPDLSAVDCLVAATGAAGNARSRSSSRGRPGRLNEVGYHLRDAFAINTDGDTVSSDFTKIKSRGNHAFNHKLDVSNRAAATPR